MGNHHDGWAEQDTGHRVDTVVSASHVNLLIGFFAGVVFDFAVWRFWIVAPLLKRHDEKEPRA